MPRLKRKTIRQRIDELDKFTLAYIECAIWASNDESTPEGGEQMSRNYDQYDLSHQALDQITSDCKDFQNANSELLETLDPEQCGQDFWLTRNGHGAGFWDRGLGDLGQKLTENCKPYGDANLYIGTGGRIYHG